MNDLEAAIVRADEANLEALPQIMHWLRHHAPRGSWGSPAALGAWPKIARVHAGSKVRTNTNAEMGAAEYRTVVTALEYAP